MLTLFAKDAGLPIYLYILCIYTHIYLYIYMFKGTFMKT